MRIFYLVNVFVKKFCLSIRAGRRQVRESVTEIESYDVKNGARQKLNFLASILSRLYTKEKIFSFTVNKRFFPIFLLD